VKLVHFPEVPFEASKQLGRDCSLSNRLSIREYG